MDFPACMQWKNVWRHEVFLPQLHWSCFLFLTLLSVVTFPERRQRHKTLPLLDFPHSTFLSFFCSNHLLSQQNAQKMLECVFFCLGVLGRKQKRNFCNASHLLKPQQFFSFSDTCSQGISHCIKEHQIGLKGSKTFITHALTCSVYPFLFVFKFLSEWPHFLSISFLSSLCSKFQQKKRPSLAIQLIPSSGGSPEQTKSSYLNFGLSKYPIKWAE